MPVRIKSKVVQEARNEFLQKFKSIIVWCEIGGLTTQNLACHEFIGRYKNQYDDEVNTLFLTHPANIIGIDNATHLNKCPDYEVCQAAIEKRPTWIWLKLGFGNWRQARMDFEQRVQEFYRTGQIKSTIPNIPKI